MSVLKKLTKEEIKTEAVLQLQAGNQGYEISLGEGFYMQYPLPADEYANFMSILRQIWFTLLADKDNTYAEAINAAKALSQNMGEIDDTEVQSSVQDLMTRLTDSRNVNPLEFLTHEKFSSELKTLLDMLTRGCDEKDRVEMTIEQLARLLEVCFIQNFLPFIRVANTANRVFRGDN